MDEKLKQEIEELLRSLQLQDSIEIGNSKTGIMKVYFNANNVEDAKRRLENVKSLLLETRKGILEG